MLGKYRVCVQTSERELLSSCRWPGGARALTLAANGATAYDLTLKRGVLLRFRAEDPEGVLPRMAQPNGTAPGIFLAGVWTKAGRFEMARLLSDDAQGVDFVLTVPLGEDLLPSVDVRNARLVGNDGSLVRGNPLSRVTLDGSQREIRYTFRVTGAEVRRAQ